MAIRQHVQAAAAEQAQDFPGYINTALIRNTENAAGLLVRVFLDNLDNIGWLLNPGETLIINAEDTSSDYSGSKICTKRLRFTGQAVGAVTVDIQYTLKTGWNQTPNRPENHPVQV